MKFSYLKLLPIFFLLLTAACHSNGHEHNTTENHNMEEHNHTIQNLNAEIFEGTGTVISVPPSKRHVIVEHGDIPGFMNAMTMPLTVRDTTLLENVSPQDSIWFEIESRANDTFIRNLEVIENE